MKKLLIFLGIISLILISLVIIVYLNLNTLLTQAVKTLGPQVLHTKVSAGKVNVALLSGTGEIKNLIIFNPKGFKSKYLFKSKKIFIKIKPTSLFTDLITIENINIDNPTLVYELNKPDNLTAFLSNLKINSDHKSAKKTKDIGDKKKITSTQNIAQDTSTAKGKKHLLIKHLIIQNINIILKTPKLVDNQITPKNIKIDKIELKNIGGKNKTYQEIAQQITIAILKKINPKILSRLKMIDVNQIKNKVENKIKTEIQKQIPFDVNNLFKRHTK